MWIRNYGGATSSILDLDKMNSNAGTPSHIH